MRDLDADVGDHVVDNWARVANYDRCFFVVSYLTREGDVHPKHMQCF